MKNKILFFLSAFYIFSSCESFIAEPLNRVDKSLSISSYVFPGFSAVKQYTLDRSLSTGSEKQLMKMSLDYNTKFDRLGVFIYTEDNFNKTDHYKKLASFDLTNDKDDDSRYVGRKIFSISESEYQKTTDSILVKLAVHEDVSNPSNQRTISKFTMFKTNSHPYGIQHYENTDISNEDIVRLYSFNDLVAKQVFDEEEGGMVFKDAGQHSKLVLMYFDSTDEEELKEKAYWNKEYILKDRSGNLCITNQRRNATIHHNPSSDYKGFVFGQDGEN